MAKIGFLGFILGLNYSAKVVLKLIQKNRFKTICYLEQF